MTYKAERVEAGCCGTCGVERKLDDGGTRVHCGSCAEKTRKLRRDAYRLKAGIPLDAPLAKQGRPRLGRPSPS